MHPQLAGGLPVPLTGFFHTCLREFLTDELDPQGRAIIEVCLNGGTLADYDHFTPDEARG